MSKYEGRIEFYIDGFPGFFEGMYTMIVLESGYVKLLINDKEFHCVAPSVLCLNEKQKWKIVNEQDIMVSSVCFVPDFLCDVFTQENISGCSLEYLCENYDFLMLLPFVNMDFDASMRSCAPQSILKQIRGIFEECIKLLNSTEPFDKYRVRSRFIDGLHLCERIFAEDARLVPQELSGLNIPNEYEETKNALQIIWDDYNNPDINATYILDKLHVHKEKLNYQFRNVTGLSIYQYILKYRLTKAMHKLIFTEDTIDSISESCGFTTYVTFTTIFKKKIGMPPQTFRQTERERRNNKTDD